MGILRRYSGLLLIPLLLAQTIILAAAPAPDEAAIRSKVSAYGIGYRVKVDLTDKSQVNGVIAGIDEKTFAVKPKGNTPAQAVPYASVQRIHKDGLSTGQKIGIGAAVIVVAFGAMIAIALAQFRHAKF